jgi:RimJ/RimL family protein N-acetyltransferase
MNSWQYYQARNLAVVPYMPSTPVYRDGMLPYLYTKTKEEGRLQATFHEDDYRMDSFISYFDRIKTMQVLCEVAGPEKNLDPKGYSWVDNPVGVDGARSAVCGFSFFDGSGKKDTARDLARLGLAYWFIDLKIDVVHGILLASNIPAKNFAQKLGFVETAVVPKWRYVGGELVDVRAMTLEAVDFLPSFQEWKSKNPVELPT